MSKRKQNRAGATGKAKPTSPSLGVIQTAGTGCGDLDELLYETLQSDALKIQGRLMTLQAYYYVFHRNYEELHNHIQTTTHPSQLMTLWDMTQDRGLYAAMGETTRLFLNFAVSAKTLVEHSRNAVRRWYKGTPFWAEYSSEVTRRFTQNDLVSFVEGLRNYVLHYELPFATGTVRAGGSMISQHYILKKQELLEWDKWNTDDAKGKAFLDAADDEVEISAIADGYYRLVSDFHQWRRNRLRELHAEELAWLAEMQQRIERAKAANRAAIDRFANEPIGPDS